jgi:hypothetical protein
MISRRLSEIFLIVAASLILSECNSIGDTQRSAQLLLPGSRAIASEKTEEMTQPQTINDFYMALAEVFEPPFGRKIYIDLSAIPQGAIFLDALRKKGKVAGQSNELRNVYAGATIVGYQHKISGEAASIARCSLERDESDAWTFTIDTSAGLGTGFGKIYKCVYNSSKWKCTQVGVIVE